MVYKRFREPTRSDWVVLPRPAGYKSGRTRQYASARRSQAAVIPRSVRSSSIVERKYFDTAFAQTVASAADWTGTEVPCTQAVDADGSSLVAYTGAALNPSARGIGYGQVVGMSYYLDRIRIRGAVGTGLLSDKADVVVPQTVRVLLIQDNQPAGVQAQGEEIMNDMGTTYAVSFSFQQMALNASRFRVLADKVITVQPAIAGTDGASTVSTTSQSRNFKISHYFKKPIRVITSGTSTTHTVAALENCNLFLLMHTDNAAAAVGVNGCARCYYHE